MSGPPVNLFDDLIPGGRSQSSGPPRAVAGPTLFDDLVPKPVTPSSLTSPSSGAPFENEDERNARPVAHAPPSAPDITGEGTEPLPWAPPAQTATDIARRAQAIQGGDDRLEGMVQQWANAHVLPGHTGPLARAARAVVDMAASPGRTAAQIGAAPIEAAVTGAQFVGQAAAETTLPDRLRAYALDDPDRISEEDAALAGLQVAAAGGVITKGAQMAGLPRLVGSLLAGKIAGAAEGAAAGAVYAPGDPAVGAVVGSIAGAAHADRLGATRPPDAPPVGQMDRLLPRAEDQTTAKVTVAESPPLGGDDFELEDIHETFARAQQELADREAADASALKTPPLDVAAQAADTGITAQHVDTPVAEGMAAVAEQGPPVISPAAPADVPTSQASAPPAALPTETSAPAARAVTPDGWLVPQVGDQVRASIHIGREVRIIGGPVEETPKGALVVRVSTNKGTSSKPMPITALQWRVDGDPQHAVAAQQQQAEAQAAIAQHHAQYVARQQEVAATHDQTPDQQLFEQWHGASPTPKGPVGTFNGESPDRATDEYITQREQATYARAGVPPKEPGWKVNETPAPTRQEGISRALDEYLSGGTATRFAKPRVTFALLKERGATDAEIQKAVEFAIATNGRNGARATIEGDEEARIAPKSNFDNLLPKRGAKDPIMLRLDGQPDRILPMEELVQAAREHFGIPQPPNEQTGGEVVPPSSRAPVSRAEIEATYAEELAKNVRKAPHKYAFGAEEAPHVAQRMVAGLAEGTANITGPALKATAQRLGITHTVAGWKAVLAGAPPQHEPVAPAPAPTPEETNGGDRTVRAEASGLSRRAPSGGAAGDAAGRDGGAVSGEGGPGGAGSVRQPSERRPAGDSRGVVGRGPGSRAPASDRLGRQPSDARPSAGAAQRLDQPAPAPNASGNYRIHSPGDIGIDAGAAGRLTNNLAAIRTLKALAEEGRQASPVEQATLAKYVGWGDTRLAKVFDETSASADTYAAERAELQSLLSPDEYAAARASTLNAHYTSPDVIKAVWAAVQRLGFSEGRVLEPSAGVGHFLGLAPDALAPNLRFTAVELDPITGGILKHLYPDADVRVQGFETVQVPDGRYDLAIGNVPFGNFQLHEPRYAKLKLSIHNHFLVKSLDAVRPGGLVALITSRYTLDAMDSGGRAAMAERGELIAALRLPETAFEQNAGTTVVTDLLLFRRRSADTPASALPGQAHVRTPEGNAEVSAYFQQHPEHILGELGVSTDRFGTPQPTVRPGATPLPEALADAIDTLPKDVMGPRVDVAATPEIDADVSHVREYGFFVATGGQILQRVRGVAVDPEIPKSAAPRVTALIGLRDALDALRAAEAAGEPDEVTEPLRTALNTQYDWFVLKHGYINTERYSVQNRTRKDGTPYELTTVRQPNLTYFTDDPRRAAVMGLEEYRKGDTPEAPPTVRKADILSRRTIRPEKILPQASTPGEALYQSINRNARVDLPWMAALLRLPEAEVRAAVEAQNLIFTNPASGADELRDVYLSGNVRQKLADAEARVSATPAFQRNIDALAPLVPKDIPPALIAVGLGASWMPSEVISDATEALLDLRTKVSHNAREGLWSVEPVRGYDRVSSAANTTTFGTERVDGLDLLRDGMAQKKTVVYDPVTRPDGSEARVVNLEATLQAQEKQARLEAEYVKWLWSDPDRSSTLAIRYNALFNSLVWPDYNGSFLELPGTATHIKGRPFSFLPTQRNAIYRGMVAGNQLLAHVVGAGKTYTMIAIGMESKRMGFSRKPAYAVPNHMLGQFSREFLELYPNANILIADEKDFAKNKRRQFVARMAQNDWDAVILTHSSFGKLPMSPAFQQRMLTEEMTALADDITAAKAGKQDRSIVKQLEASKKRLSARMASLAANDAKDADFITFEETGIDQLFVDELHLFKNLWARTRMQGLPIASSERAFDMHWKSRYLDEINPGRGFTGATGTPVSNSLVEMYTLQRYFAPKQLSDRGLQSVDSWFSVFGKMVTAAELSADGSGYAMKSRPSAFNNLPELSQLFREFADVQGADDVFPKPPDGSRPRLPPVIGGAPKLVVVDPTTAQLAYTRHLVGRGEAVRARRVTPEEDNILKIFTEGRTAAVDLRLLSGHAPEGSALLDAVVQQAVNLYHETSPLRGVQLIFADVGTPKEVRAPKPVAPGDEGTDDEAAFEAAPDAPDAPTEQVPDVARTSFSLYSAIKAALVEAGVPAQEVAYVHDAKNNAGRQRMFAAVRNGSVRFLIGSTDKMGAGTNVQDRLVGLHHVDVPRSMRPADIEQRNGRILRQGNVLYDNGDIDGVHIWMYGTKRTMAANLWDMQERKARMTTSVVKGQPGGPRSMDDIDGQVRDFETMKALASGNPLVMERVGLEKDIATLGAAKRGHAQQLAQSVEEMRRAQFVRLPERQKQVEQAREDAVAAEAIDTKGDKFRMEIMRKPYTDRKEAGKALVAAAKTVLTREHTSGDWVTIGRLGDFVIVAQKSMGNATFGLSRKGLYRSEASLTDATGGVVGEGYGMIRSLEALPARVPEVLAWAEHDIEKTQQQITALRTAATAPWERQDELTAKEERYAVVKGLTESDGPKTRLEAMAPELSPKWWALAREGVFPYVEVPEDKDGLDGMFGTPGAPDGRDLTGTDGLAGPLLEPNLSFLGLGGFQKFFEPGARATFRPVEAAASREVEDRWMAARGIPPAARASMRATLGRVVQSFRRHFPLLDTKQDLRIAASADILRRVEAIPSWSKAAAVDRIRFVIGDLTAPQLDLATRVLVLRDLGRSIEEGNYGPAGAPTKDLPFGYQDPAAVDADLGRFERAAQQDPKVWSSLDRRAAFATALTRRLVELDELPESALVDDRYYHRQVMEYMAAKSPQYVGVGAREARTRTKGFQKQRTGGGDFNTAYQEAEFEWVAQAYAKIAMREAQAELKALNDIRPALVRQAKTENGQAIEHRVLALWSAATSGNLAAAKQLGAWGITDIAAAQDPTLRFRQQIARATQQIYQGLVQPGTRWPGFESMASQLSSAWAAHQALPTSERRTRPFKFAHPDFFRFLDQQIETDGPLSGPAKGIYAAFRDGKAFSKAVLADAERDWRDLIPETHAIWQPEEGSVWYRAATIEDGTLDAILHGGQSLADADIRRALVMGGRKEEWVVPTELAQTLNELQPAKNSEAIEGLFQQLVGAWKQWTLLNPWRGFKYNLNNQFGDADAVYAYDPRIFGFAPQATQDLWAYLKGRASEPVRAEILNAMRLRVVGSGLTIAEIPDISKLAAFRGISGYTPDVLTATVEGYWRTVKDYTNFRENVLRLAAYRFFERERQIGNTRYGVSKSYEVDALQGPARSAKLAAELLIDYGNISHGGQWVRQRLIPFYSWMEGNAPRYYRLIANAPLEREDGAGAAGASPGGGTGGGSGGSAGAKAGRAAPGLALRLGALALKMNAMYLAVWLWNRLNHPDEQESLRRAGQGNNLILGTREDGSIMSIRVEGAFADALKWVALNDWPADVEDLIHGHATLAGKAAEATKAPLDRVVQSWEPFSKSLFELSTGRTTYPNLFKEGTSYRFATHPIRDRADEVARTFSLDWLYKMVSHQPSRPGNPVVNAVESLGTYQTDAGEAAYYYARDLIRQWQDQTGHQDAGGDATDKSTALAYFKMAARWGDDDAARYWLDQYKILGGKQQGITESLRLSSPLGTLSEQRRGQFLRTLTPMERAAVDDAVAWWKGQDGEAAKIHQTLKNIRPGPNVPAAPGAQPPTGGVGVRRQEG